VRDFQQRVDVVEIDLPEPEYLHLFWVRGRQLDVFPQGPKEEVIVGLVLDIALKPLGPFVSCTSEVTIAGMVALDTRDHIVIVIAITVTVRVVFTFAFDLALFIIIGI
jgi:hypothetical protein